MPRVMVTREGFVALVYRKLNPFQNANDTKHDDIPPLRNLLDFGGWRLGVSKNSGFSPQIIH